MPVCDVFSRVLMFSATRLPARVWIAPHESELVGLKDTHTHANTHAHTRKHTLKKPSVSLHPVAIFVNRLCNSDKKQLQ